MFIIIAFVLLTTSFSHEVFALTQQTKSEDSQIACREITQTDYGYSQCLSLAQKGKINAEEIHDCKKEEDYFTIRCLYELARVRQICDCIATSYTCPCLKKRTESYCKKQAIKLCGDK